jgi:2-keto-3-deoxy-L-rhamnonate aldolase RhmA
MTGEELKQRTRAGGVVYGTMLSTARNPRWAATIAAFGLDYVIIDTEHSPQGRSDVANLLAALAGTGTVPIVRIPIPDSHYVTMALDAGAQGILAPYCETVEQVKEVVAAAKWRPLKGDLVTAVVDHGKFPSEMSREYLEKRSRNTVCIIGIESVPAIERLDAILGVEGIDAIFVGPNDLSISLGVPDQMDHPDYEAALRRILSICKAHGVPTLIHHQTVELTTKWLREGARFVLHSSDTRAMHAGVRAYFTPIREVGEEVGGSAAVAIGESEEVI